MNDAPNNAALAEGPTMTPTRKAALWGAGLAATLGIAGLAAQAPHVGDPGLPQTFPGLIALYVGYALPWALAGGSLGFLAGRHKR